MSKTITQTETEAPYIQDLRADLEKVSKTFRPQKTIGIILMIIGIVGFLGLALAKSGVIHTGFHAIDAKACTLFTHKWDAMASSCSRFHPQVIVTILSSVLVLTGLAMFSNYRLEKSHFENSAVFKDYTGKSHIESDL